MSNIFNFHRDPPRTLLPLLVVGARLIDPATRRVSLIGKSLSEFAVSPGQTLSLRTPTTTCRSVWRRYPIRAFDPVEVLVEIDAPADAIWARAAEIGDPVIAEAPCGRAQARARLAALGPSHAMWALALPLIAAVGLGG